MSASQQSVAELVTLPLDDITVPPGNHRQDLGDLGSLAESIRGIGIIQPVTVRPRVGGGYELVAGQRRLAAARLAGLTSLDAFVRSYEDVESRKAMAVENINRKNLAPLEEASAYQELLNLGVESSEVATLAGTTPNQVSDYTSLLTLPKKVQRELRSGAINFSDALLLGQLVDTPERITRALDNAGKGWSLAAAVQHELHDRELARKMASSRTELEKRGVPIIERPRESFSRRARMQRLGNGWGCIPITQAKHAKEECHAAYIDDYSGEIVYVCTDVRRHAGVVPGIEIPADAKAQRAAKRAERRAQKYALTARRELLASHLQDISDAAAAAEHVARVALLDVEENVAALACELLDLSGVKVEYHGSTRTLAGRVRQRPDDIHRVALALALGRGEVYAGREYTSLDQSAVVAEHMRYMESLGYELTDAERSRLQSYDIEVAAENASDQNEADAVS